MHWGLVSRRIFETAALRGSAALLAEDPADPDAAGWNRLLLASRGWTIGGGTTEMQRNMLGEMYSAAPAPSGRGADSSQNLHVSRGIPPPPVPYHRVMESRLVLPDLPDWAGLRMARPAGGDVVVAALAAGLLVDLAVRSDGALGGALLAAATASLLLGTGRTESRQSRVLLGLAPVFGAFLALRASPWLLPFDVLAAGALLVLSSSLARGGSVLDLPFLGLAGRIIHGALHGLAGPAFAWQGIFRFRGGDGLDGVTPVSARRWAAVLRGLVLALPILLVLGALLASADVVFAHLFELAPDVDDVGQHVALVAIGAWGMAGLLRLASATPPGAGRQRFPLVGPVEATVVLGSLVALFTAFAATQLVSLGGGSRTILETEGLTYAEYARSGFFQLVAVAAITFAVLLAVDILTEPSDRATRRRLLIMSEVCIALTLVVVVTALHRLDLYENAYGLTMLRFYAGFFVILVGVSLGLLGVWFAGPRRRAWFPAAAVGAGLAGLLLLNLVNPEALVVRRNVALAERTGRFDTSYLFELSDDAIPELVRTLPRLDATTQAAVLAHVCEVPATADGGWAGWNRSERKAIAARDQVCS